jgi:chromosome segregation ATPase
MFNTSKLNSIKLVCPKCRLRQQLRMEFLGEVLTCVHCRHQFKPHVVLPCPLCRGSLSVGLEILGRDTSCKHCGGRFRAEIRVQCPLCPKNLKVLPEFIGHKVTCKGCKQTIRASLIDEQIVVSRVFPEEGSRPEVAGESQLQIPAIGEHIPESQVGMVAAEARTVQYPVFAPPAKSSSSQETLPEASALQDPRDARSAECRELMAQLAQSQARSSRTEQAQQAEIDRLKAELKKSQLKVVDDAERIKESERRSRLINAFEKAQSKYDQLRAARETAQQEVEGLRARVKELELSFTDANTACADVEAAHALELQEERGRADAAVRVLQAQWELRSENLLRKMEEFRTDAAKAEADRQRLQSQIDAMRAHSEQECRTLKEELTQLQEQATRLALERDTALKRMDSLIPPCEHERLRAAHDSAQLETEALQGRVKDLEQKLTDANIACADVEAAHALELQEERGRADAAVRVLQAQWELTSESLLCKMEEFRSDAAKAEADRQRLQSQIDAMRAHSEQECKALKEELTQLQEQAARFALERDTALKRIDSLASAEIGLTEQTRTATRARREVEDRLQAKIVSLEQDLKAAREQTEDTARHLSNVAKQLCDEQREREKQRQSEMNQAQMVVALEERLRLAQAVAEEKEKQCVSLNVKNAENYALLKVETQRLGEANAVLRGAHDRLLADCNDGNRTRKELIQQVQDLESQLAKEKLCAAALHQELGSAKHDAEVELTRLTESWTKERAHLQKEERQSQELLAAARRTFDQECAAIHSEIERLHKERGVLKAERDEFRDQLTQLAQEKAKWRLHSDDLRVSRQDAEERWRIEVTSLSQAALQAQQDLHKLQKELEEHHQRAAIQLSESAILQQEQEAAKHEAAAAKRELASVREAFEQERLGLEGELEELRQQLLESAHALAPGGKSEIASTNLEARLPVEAARLGEFAKKIETLEAELERQGAVRSEAGKQRRRGFGVIGGPLRLFGKRPATDPNDSQSDEQAPERRLRALWTEVMSRRERVIHETANAMRASLENQLVDLHGQLARAQERADRLEVELEATRGPSGLQQES